MELEGGDGNGKGDFVAFETMEKDLVFYGIWYFQGIFYLCMYIDTYIGVCMYIYIYIHTYTV